jgi:formamidopyrimidine-DNA glycosylase
MPELPEVETIRSDLEAGAVGKTIQKIEIRKKRLVKNDASVFRKTLKGNSFASAGRVGKLLIFRLSEGDKYLLVHLKMTGQLIYCEGENIIAGGHSLPKIQGCLPNKYSHVYFVFEDDSHLFFNDMRTFGYLKLVGSDELARIKSRYGPEPLSKEFSLDYLRDLLARRRTSIKAVLLDQKAIAGIGNIYADEILFQAGVLPWRYAFSLTEDEMKKLFSSSRRVIRLAIKNRGTTFNDYVDANGNIGGFSRLLKVYGRAGEKCRSCGSRVGKTRVAQRGTYYCPECQK